MGRRWHWAAIPLMEQGIDTFSALLPSLASGWLLQLQQKYWEWVGAVTDIRGAGPTDSGWAQAAAILTLRSVRKSQRSDKEEMQGHISTGRPSRVGPCASWYSHPLTI